MRVRVKICGINTREAAQAATTAGADAVGFVFAESPREVTIETAVNVAAVLPPFVARVAVFRHPSPQWVEEVVRRFNPDVVQTEPDDAVIGTLPDPQRLLPVFHDHPELLAEVETFRHRTGVHRGLLEAAGRGGRGVQPDWTRARALAATIPLVLAGGLHPGNVEHAIAEVGPYAVDVSSGVEDAPGIKSADKIEAFVRAVRACATPPPVATTRKDRA